MAIWLTMLHLLHFGCTVCLGTFLRAVMLGLFVTAAIIGCNDLICIYCHSTHKVPLLVQSGKSYRIGFE